MIINNKNSNSVKKKLYIFLSVLFVTGFAMVFMTNCSTSTSEQSDVKGGGQSKINNTVQADKSKVINEPANASSKALELNEKDFDNTIKKGVVLVDFWAPWCGPCRTQGPIVDELVKEIGGKAVITKVNVDNNNAISSKYEVRNIPTIIIFKDGKPKMRFVGVQDKEFLVQQIESLL